MHRSLVMNALTLHFSIFTIRIIWSIDSQYWSLNPIEMYFNPHKYAIISQSSGLNCGFIYSMILFFKNICQNKFLFPKFILYLYSKYLTSFFLI